MSDFDFKVRSEGGLARIDLSRPDEGNALTRGMMFRLAELIRELAAESQHRVVVIEARGAQFCRGRDGKGESTEGLSVYEIRQKMMGATLGVYEAITAAPIPVVALVRGDAIGFGAALAGACDITLAQSDVHFSFTEIKHGIPPIMAMAALAKKVPAKMLSYLIYSARVISAEEARTFGLVSHVITVDSFVAESETTLTELASRSRLILETIKKYQLAEGALSPAMASEYAGTLLALVRN